MISSALTPLHADLIPTTDFSFVEPDPNPDDDSIFADGGVVIPTIMFNLTDADIPNVTFEVDFDLIDAGIEIFVNDNSLFTTGPDVSEFNGANSEVFTGTGATNLGAPFGPRTDTAPRLIVNSDSTGTFFSGPNLAPTDTLPDPAPIINYTPGFAVNNFTSFLQAGTNEIEIVSLNNFQSAALAGSYSVGLQTAAVPEPSSLSLCLAGAMCCMARRRRRKA